MEKRLNFKRQVISQISLVFMLPESVMYMFNKIINVHSKKPREWFYTRYMFPCSAIIEICFSAMPCILGIQKNGGFFHILITAIRIYTIKCTPQPYFYHP